MKLLKIFPILVLLSCLTHTIERTITVKAIGWRFTLPSETSIKDSAFDANGELVAKIPDNGPSLRLFTIKDSSSGSFSSYLRKDTSKFQDWRNFHDTDSKRYFEQLKKLPQMKLLDTKYFTQTIDTINFLVQYAKYVRKDKMDTGYVYHYYGKIRDFELDISFEYYDSLIGKKYMDIIKSSTLKK